MGIIKVLPEIVANKIAAGEVIERPSSIVKELVENSLDAGARTVEVEIRHGGKSLIRVADDGSGMSPEDAELAFQRHATSKILDAQDLERIGSFGFRGEALPSLAAVSRVRMVTRTAESPEGTEILIEGGKLAGAKECPAAKGTAVEVRDLFFNTPARRKFLKSETTETGHIQETLANLALSRLDVRFVLKFDGRTAFDFFAGMGLKDRLAILWGAEAAKHLLEIQSETSAVRIHGLIGKPFLARSNRTGQSFFINGRWVRSLALSYGLQAGFHGLLMQGQYPAAVVFLELDLERVDVNVHPTKQEVRISQESALKSLLQETAAKRLAEEADLAPQMKAARIEAEVWQASSGPASAPLSQSFTRPFAPGFANSPAAGLQTAAAAMAHAEPSAESPILLRGKLGITKILGQIHNTFIVVETEEGLLIMDQHAAHERINFEALVKNFEAAAPASQRLLMQEVLELGMRPAELMRDSLPFLSKLGFEIETFGENAFVIRSVPAILADENPVPLLKTFLEEKEEGRIKTGLEGKAEDIAALISCKRKSVKAHDPIAYPVLVSLVERLSACENPFSCPHGRPAFLNYRFNELEKQFKRVL